MKVKLKLNSAAIKEFFKEQGEKFVFGFGVLILLYFIYSIFQRESLPTNLQPAALSKEITVAETNVQNTVYDGSDLKPLEVPGTIAPLPIDKLADIQPFVMPDGPFEDPHKRTDPNLFPALALQVYAGISSIELGGQGPAAPAIRGPGNPGGMPVRGGMPKDPGPAPVRIPRGGRAAAPAVPPAKVPAPVASGPNSLLGHPAAGADADANVSQPLPPNFNIPGVPGNGNAKVRRYVMITGALPVLQQQKEFDIRFAHARRADTEAAAGAGAQARDRQQGNRDVPRYVWWRLERTDLSNGQLKTVIDYGDVPQILADRKDPSIGADLVTKSLKPGRGFPRLTTDMLTWQGNGAEVVPNDYLDDPWICWPLPPLLMHDWGREATNPLIPLVPPQANDAEPANPAAPADPAAKPAEADPFGGKDVTADKSMPTSRPGMGRGGMPAIGRGRDMGAMPGGPVAPEIPYRLFRFVDFDVEPGHTYQYRVQLVLKNPNFGLEPQVLMKPDPKPEPYRDTPWSELSGPTTVPLETRLVADGVDRPRRGDVKGLMGILMWDTKSAVELLDTETLELGVVANFMQKKLLAVVDPVNRNIHDFTVDFLTDGALIDLRGGGEKAAGDKSTEAVEPGELLFLVVGKDGKPDQLVVVNQARDKAAIAEWEKYHKPPAESADAGDSGGLLGGPSPATTPRTTGPSGGLIPPATTRGGMPTRGGTGTPRGR